jgi:hypothetical protein
MLAGVAAGVLKWFLGNGLQTLGKLGVDAYKEKLGAENNTEQRVADLASKSIALGQREAELNARILEVEQGNWFTRWVRPVWAFPFVFWTYKVIIWDICFGWGSTIDLKGTPGYLCLLVAGSYFGERLGSKWLDKIAQLRGNITGKNNNG